MIKHQGRVVARFRSEVCKKGGSAPDWAVHAPNRAVSSFQVKLSDSIQPLSMVSVGVELKAVGVFNDDTLGHTGDVPVTSLWDAATRDVPLIAGNVGIDADAVLTLGVVFVPKDTSRGNRDVAAAAAAEPQPAIAVATVVGDGSQPDVIQYVAPDQQRAAEAHFAQAATNEWQKERT